MRRHHYYLAALCLACLLGLAVVAQAAPEPRVRMLIIESGSMVPAYPIGTKIVAIPLPEYRVGDVVAVRHPDHAKLLVHRIVAINARTVTTKGDANSKSDRPVSVRLIAGRVYP